MSQPIMSHIEADLLAYLHGELSPAASQAVEAHLTQCPACRAELVELRALDAGLNQVIPAAYQSVHLSRAAEQRIRNALAVERGRQQRGRGWQQALAALAAGLRPLSKAAIPVVALFFVVLTIRAAQLPTQPGAQQMLVLGQNTFAPGTAGAVRVLVRDSASDQPIANANVNVALRQPVAGLAKTVYAGTTDTTGSAPVNFQVPADWEGDAELIVEASSDLGNDEVVAPIRLARSYRLLLSSDKPVYQPGETLHLRTLALGTVDGRPAQSAVVRFEVLDPRGVVLLSQDVSTSDFGIAAVDLPLAADAHLGQYQLRASLGDTVSQLSVDVGQAPLPNFRVDVLADAPFYRPGQVLSGQVDASYFFGRPVGNAPVTLRAVASKQGATAAEGDLRVFVQEAEGRTDDAGRFAFQIRLPDLPAETFAAPAAGSGPAETTLALDLEATVTDATGHSEFGFQKLTLARQPILIDVVAEGGTLRTGVENILYVLTSYPDGTPVASTVNVQIGSAAPFDEVTSDAGIAEIRFTPRQGDTGSRNVRVTATDAAGQQGTTQVTLPLDEARETLLLRTDQAIYQVGDTMALEALATGAANSVFLDVVKGGQLLLTQSAPVVDGKATFAVDLTPELAGTLELNAYQVGADNNALRDARVVLVDQPETLQVLLSTDQEQYGPGQEAVLNAQTKTVTESVQAAVGLSVVNEAVYAQRQYQPGFARAYFLVDEALQKAGVDPAASMAADQAGAERAVQQLARASWAGYRGASYTLAAQSVDQQSRAVVNDARTRSLYRLSIAISLALGLAAVLVAVVVVAGLRRSGVLGKALTRVFLTLLVLALAGGAVVAGLQLALGGLPESVAWAVLAIGAGLWLLVLIGLAVYAWRNRDQAAQYVVLLTLTYVIGLGLLAFAAGQGVVLSTLWIGLLAVGFGLWLTALLLFGWSLRLEGRRKAGAAVLLLALLLVPLIGAVSVVDSAGTDLIEEIAGPSVVGFPGGLLMGCAAPASQVSQEVVEAETPGEAAVAEPPQAPALPTAVEVPAELEVAPLAAPQPEEALPAVEAEQAPSAADAAASQEAPARKAAPAPTEIPSLVLVAETPTATVESLAVESLVLTPTLTATLPVTLAESLPALAPTTTPTATVAVTVTVAVTRDVRLAGSAPLSPTATLAPTQPLAVTTPEAAVAAAVVEPSPTPTPMLSAPTATLAPAPTPTPEPPPTPQVQALAAPSPEPTLPAPAIGLEAFGLGGGATGAPAAASSVAPEALPIIRERFPQTLYWNPQIVTDESGRLRVTIPTGDAITTWRVTALAVDRRGRLGSATLPLVVFKPLFLNLNLPPSMALGAETLTGVQLFNYSAQPLPVVLSVQTSSGLAAQLSASEVTVPANEVMVVPVRLQALQPGQQTLTVGVQGPGVQDAQQAGITVE